MRHKKFSLGRLSPLIIYEFLTLCYSVLVHATLYNKDTNEQNFCDRISTSKTNNVSAEFWCLHGHYWKNGMNYTLLPTNDTNDLSNQKIILTKCESLPTRWRSPMPLCRESCDGKEVQVEGHRFLDVTFSQKESSAYPGRYTTDTTASFSCTGSHILLQGASSISCDGNGSWGSFTFPECVPTCESFPVKGKGIEIDYHSSQTPTPDGRYVDQSVAVFRCSAPYHDLKGSASLVCMTHQNSGTARWSGIQPYCESTCDSIALISNETYLTMHYEPLAIDGRFEPSLNGRFSVDTIAKYGCDDHHGIVYKLVGESKSICQNTGRWTRVFPEPVCVPTCSSDGLLLLSTDGVPFLKIEVVGDNFNDMNKEGVRYIAESIGTFTCIDEELQLIGEAKTTTCLRNGSWTDHHGLQCVKTCPELPPTSTINLTYSKHSLPNKSLPVRYSPGTKVSTACKDSTNQLMGSKEMLCTQEGIWEGYKDGMSCLATCRNPFVTGPTWVNNDEGPMFINSSFSNTALEEPRDRYPIDTIVTHECSGNGLKMNGTRTQKCLPSGEWDGTFPNCIDDGIEELESSPRHVDALVTVIILLIALICALFSTAVIINYLRKKNGEKGLIELFRDGCSRFKNRKQSQPIPTSDP